MLKLEFAERTSPGKIRGNNEDAVAHVVPEAEAQTRGYLFCIADGMGAHAHGEVASKLAVETTCSEFRSGPKGVMHVSLLPRIVQAANIAVYDAGHGRVSNGSNMGSTLVVCALRFDSAVVSHVGDSRCYLFRAGTLTQLTHDHTMRNEHMRLGILSSADAGSEESNSILTRALGLELFVAADTITVNVVVGDLLMLCTDGLHGYVPEATIRALMTSPQGPDHIADSLISAAHDAGAPDNVSVQLIRILSVERMGLYRGRPYRLL
jgi:serine/threonine protein phosphatase PrpC